MGGKCTVIGVISDTHNDLPSGIAEEFSGVDVILHAGDITSREILDQLSQTAPVRAVRGNMDSSLWARDLPETRLLEYRGVSIYMLHDLARLDINPESAGVQVVIHGHTHRPRVLQRGRVLYLNPGSAGASRSGPPSAARLTLQEGQVQADIIKLVER